MKNLTYPWLILIGSVVYYGFTISEFKLSHADVVYRLTDLHHLATLPVEGEKSGMFSSYDRQSTVYDVTGEFVFR